jgi:dihydropteroate synthase
MGVVNVTPDSFSDGGHFLDHQAAIAHGRTLVGQGADWIDVGGESTRPRAEPVPVDEELRRVIPVVEALASEGVAVSIDTRKAAVAEAAVAAGARMINDVSASLAAVAGTTGAAFVAMHMLGDPRTMQADPAYGDVVTEVRDFLVERADAARAAGVREVWIDPGIGFGKTLDHNLDLLANLDVLVATGYPARRHRYRPAGRRPPGGLDRHRRLVVAARRQHVARPRGARHREGRRGLRQGAGRRVSFPRST